jgi:uncharacterized protein (TIGR02246 family)
MNRFTLATCVAAVIVLGGQRAFAADKAIEDAIRQSAEEFTEAYNHGNADAVAAQWTPDGEYTIGRESLKGREQIAKLYGEFFRTHAGSKIEVKIESIRVIAPTVAIEQGTAATTMGEGGRRTESSYTAVHVKLGDRWLMANVRESEMPTVSGTARLDDIAWLAGAWAADGDASRIEMNYDWLNDKHFLRGHVAMSGKDATKSGGTHVIGKDPASGRLVSWFFNADGGHGYGEWSQEGSRWMIDTQGVSADGAPTSATNILYHADDDVASWQSVNRMIGDLRLPDTKEVVIERVSSP